MRVSRAEVGSLFLPFFSLRRIATKKCACTVSGLQSHYDSVIIRIFSFFPGNISDIMHKRKYRQNPNINTRPKLHSHDQKSLFQSLFWQFFWHAWSFWHPFCARRGSRMQSGLSFFAAAHLQRWPHIFARVKLFLRRRKIEEQRNYFSMNFNSMRNFWTCLEKVIHISQQSTFRIFFSIFNNIIHQFDCRNFFL